MLSRFRAWLSEATTLKTINGRLAWAWLAFGLIGIFANGIRSSIPVLFFISVYANVAGHWSAWQAGRTEILQEQAEEQAHG